MGREKITFTHFRKPDGRKQYLTMTEINEDAANYINENNIQISTEDGLRNDVIVYADDGTMMEDGSTPDEIIVISRGRNCKETMDEVVGLLKKRAVS